MPSATSGTEHKAVVLPTAFTGMPEPFVVEPGLPTTAVSDFSGAAGAPATRSRKGWDRRLFPVASGCHAHASDPRGSTRFPPAPDGRATHG